MIKPEDLDYLTYCSYRVNRGYSPDIPPERWAEIYGDVTEMERRYQAELALGLPYHGSASLEMAELGANR